MPDDLRVWLERVRSELNMTDEFVGETREQWLCRWSIRYGFALIAKVEELAGALEVYADPNRWEIAYDVDTGDIADDRHVFVTDDSEPWGVAKSALCAPGGERRE